MKSYLFGFFSFLMLGVGLLLFLKRKGREGQVEEKSTLDILKSIENKLDLLLIKNVENSSEEDI